MAQRYCYNDAKLLFESVLAAVGGMLKFVDVEGVKNQMKQQVMFWDLRVYYHSEENVKRLNAAKDPGEFSVPSSREKYDLIQRLRDNVSWERCDLKFSGTFMEI